MPKAPANPVPALKDRYPRTVAAAGERSFELRLMARGDAAAMVKFARGLPADDLLFLRRNITERSAVDGWIDNIQAGQAVAILALEGKQLAGYVSLNLNMATWMRHLGEIRLLTGQGYRGVGLGRILAAEVYAVASALGLRKLSAQMTLDQAGARATFERLGFRPEALLTDWVMDASGRTRDLLVMAYDLEGLTDTVDA
ncbi:MAG TPA: GNAT family N-acetyltransferase [Tepidiformaceae bacterium]|nr:GNAT family N-acetyltransferase [Tepidiformaceae bacterium]HMO94522.1 GNAT family N-acetyltransferase [Tepidiformaceae bacterium]